MGHSSKFVFPLPGRKHKKQQKPTPPPPSGAFPLTKAHKVLGTTGVGIDAAAFQAWEAQSNAGISVAVSDTTNGEAAFGQTNNGWAATNVQRERRWEDESDIIPAALNRPPVPGSMVPDGHTDASSLRRRQSSSTITSYYDKTNLPLSISQQTSNSAMAKGLPSKAQALLDIDGKFSDPPARMARKKPSRLDLSSLLPKHRSQKFLHPDSNRIQVLGPDMMTQSPSPMSISPAPTPPPIQQRTDRTVRKRITMESLREKPAPAASPLSPADRPDNRKQHPVVANADLYNLYDHYEQRAFNDAMEQEYHDDPGYDFELPDRQVPVPTGKAYLSPFPINVSRAAQPSKQPPLAGNPVEKRAGVAIPSSPASTPADCASVSSRHTRTSKASKRTDFSMNEIDLLQNSVLALSSDSDDDYEHSSSKGSLAVPTLSDGQASPTSPRSAMSQRNAADPYDAYRSKPAKRTSFATNPQFFSANHDPVSAQGPKIAPRSSSLGPKSSGKQVQALAQQTSRLSIGTTSTDRTVSLKSPSSLSGTKGPKTSDSQFDFPAPPVHRPQRAASLSRSLEQTQHSSPTSLDFHQLSRRSSMTHDNGSIRSGTSLGSAMSLGSARNGGRRSSTTSSIHDDSSGRFMAVTRQEEMLLAALRMKRARMREDIIAEFGDVDRDENPLRRQTTNESIATSGGMSRQSSQSTMRQEGAMLSARPRDQASKGTAEKRVLKLGLPIVTQTMYEPNGGDFLDFDEGTGSMSPVGCQRSDSKASLGSQKSGSGRNRASLNAMTAPTPRRPQRREGSIPRRGSEQTNPKQNDLPHQIPEDPAEDDDPGIPRPDSPISPSDFPAPVSIKNKKQVRLSAVGYYKSSDAGW